MNFMFGKNLKLNKIFLGKHKKTKIGVAFGGGGARGFAHIGAVRAFEEYGIKFDYVCGTSAGSIVGAFYSAGYKYEEMVKVAKSINLSDIRTSKIPLIPSKTDGIQDVMTRFLGDINIEDLKIPFSCVSCDMKSTKEAIFTKGNLAKAVAGSCCVPVIFAPVEYNNCLLCDGGLHNTIPCDVPKRYGCDYVVGVDVNKSRLYGTESAKIIDIVACTVRILMKETAVKGYNYADVMIGPETKRFKSTKTQGMMELIEEGYKETIDKMPQILELFNRKPFKAKKKLKFDTDVIIY